LPLSTAREAGLRAPPGAGCPLTVESLLEVPSRMGQLSRQAPWHRPGSCDARIGIPSVLSEEGVATIQTRTKEIMSNQEIAVRLAAAILLPSVALPARRANIETGDEQIELAAELAVRVYKMVLGVLEPPELP